MSLAQQRMWFINRFDPESAAYNIPMALRMSGELDVDALQAAVRDVINRHESLRTVYPEIDGVGIQKVLPTSDIDLDLTPTHLTEADLITVVSDVVTVGFDVTAEVPLRGRLFQLDRSEYVVVFVVHHISGDGFSMGPLARDVMTAYLARVAGEEPSWATLPVQYADYTLWQREVLGSEDDPQSVTGHQIGFWKRELAGLPDQLDLPADRPRPAVQSLRGASVDISIDADLHRGLAQLGRRSNATLFMVVHTAWAAFLARMTGTDDIAVGSPIAGRSERELDDLIGMFVNTLVFRTRVEPDQSFAELLERTRETDLNVFANADVPFERLVEVLNPARSTARHPLFQVGLSFQNLTQSTFELPGLTLSAVEADTHVSQFDLHLIVSDLYDADGTELGLSGTMTYATDLFDEATAAGLVGRFVRMLDAIMSDATVPLGDIELLEPEEKSRILEGWNDTAHVADSVTTLVDLFEEQVRRDPDATAWCSRVSC